MNVDLKYIWQDRDRHGNLRIYVAVPGRRKVRIREEPGTKAFLDAYRDAIENPPQADGKAAKRGSLRWLVQQYRSSGAFKQLGATTRKRRLVTLHEICDERFNDAGKAEPLHGEKPYSRLEPKHVLRIRDARAEFPEAANFRLKALRRLFAWAADPNVDLAKTNPAASVEYLKSNNPEGFHTWTIDEILQYMKRHPIGTKARLALDVLLYTGARRSDVVSFGNQMVRDGWLRWVEHKGRNKIRKERAIPILPPLRASLDACPSGHMVWLVTAFGKPFTFNGFGNRFKKWCVEAGLPHCSCHGLRKGGATIAAENGATERQLMAIYGWETAKQAAVYTKNADRKKLAGDAMHLISVEPTEDENTPTSVGSHSHRKI